MSLLLIGSMVGREGFEPPQAYFYAADLQSTELNQCSAYPLSMCCNGRDRVIRTLDLLHPMQARYQAAPCPVYCNSSGSCVAAGASRPLRCQRSVPLRRHGPKSEFQARKKRGPRAGTGPVGASLADYGLGWFGARPLASPADQGAPYRTRSRNTGARAAMGAPAGPNHRAQRRSPSEQPGRQRLQCCVR